MKFHHYTLENCNSATGVVVVIDVLRAFSTAAYAFAAGVEDIYLVSTVEQAFALKDELDPSFIMGEVDGLPVDGFDYGNSPPQFDGVKLSGMNLIQRTTSGTQGVVRSINADKMLTTGFCTASATVEFINRISPKDVSFVITGKRTGGWGDEDQACADYIESKLTNKYVDPEPYLLRVGNSRPGRYFNNPNMAEYPKKDLEYCLAINKFDFVMIVQRSKEHLRMRASKL